MSKTGKLKANGWGGAPLSVPLRRRQGFSEPEAAALGRGRLGHGDSEERTGSRDRQPECESWPCHLTLALNELIFPSAWVSSSIRWRG